MVDSTGARELDWLLEGLGQEMAHCLMINKNQREQQSGRLSAKGQTKGDG
jgi:hypothetical protein